MINDIQIKINNGNKNIFYLESVIVKLFLILENINLQFDKYYIKLHKYYIYYE